MENERWHDIFGYEGFYQISDHGRVKSLARTRKGAKNGICKVSERIMKPHTDKYGYLVIALSKNGKMKYFTIHRLVALMYRPNVFPMFTDQVNHIDGNKLNNHYTNLEWCSHEYNQREAVRLGLKGGKPYKARVDSKPIFKIDKTGKIVKRYDSLAEATRDSGFLKTAIQNCLKGRSASSGGFLWKYAEIENPINIFENRVSK